MWTWATARGNFHEEDLAPSSNFFGGSPIKVACSSDLPGGAFVLVWGFPLPAGRCQVESVSRVYGGVKHCRRAGGVYGLGLADQICRCSGGLFIFDAHTPPGTYKFSRAPRGEAQPRTWHGLGALSGRKHGGPSAPQSVAISAQGGQKFAPTHPPRECGSISPDAVVWCSSE